MSEEGTNGKSNGGNGREGPADPFAHGVWLLTSMSGADMIALIDGSEGKEDDVEKEMLAELKEYRSIMIDAKRKYMLKEITFPMPEMAPNGARTGRLIPGSLPSSCKHENTIELTHEFVTHMTITSFTFLGEIHPDDVEMLRTSVRNADASAETVARVIRSHLVVPQSAGLR